MGTSVPLPRETSKFHHLSGLAQSKTFHSLAFWASKTAELRSAAASKVSPDALCPLSAEQQTGNGGR